MINTLQSLREEFARYIPSGEVEALSHVVMKGKGSTYTDTEGRKYLDFSCGIFTNSFGHGEPELSQELFEAFSKLGNIHGRHWIGELEVYRKLFSYLPEGDYRAVSYGSGGGYIIDRIETELHYYFSKRKYRLAAFASGFHGKTQGTKLTVDRTHDSTFFFSDVIPDPDCLNCPCGQQRNICRMQCADLAEQVMIQNNTDVLIFEPVIGSKVIIPPNGYLRRIVNFCHEREILTVADEVLTAGGRLGEFFASRMFSISPDVIAVTKGLANGMPMSIMFMKKELTENQYSKRKGNYSSTFMNVPALMALTGAVLAKLERENIFLNVRQRSRELLEGLGLLKECYPVIRDVRGLGLMSAIEFAEDFGVFRAAERNGLELIDSGNILRIGPPLNVSSEEIVVGLEKLKQSIEEALK